MHSGHFGIGVFAAFAVNFEIPPGGFLKQRAPHVYLNLPAGPGLYLSRPPVTRLQMVYHFP